MHQLILVAIHTSQLPNVVEGIKYTICKLECIDVAQPVLNLRIDDKFRQAQDFTHQMECISESRLLSFLCGKSLHGFQIEVIIQMQIGQVLAVDKQV